MNCKGGGRKNAQSRVTRDTRNLLSTNVSGSYRGKGAVVGVITREQSRILYEHGRSFQDERDKKLDVDEVPGTTQPPVERRGQRQCRRSKYVTTSRGHIVTPYCYTLNQYTYNV